MGVRIAVSAEELSFAKTLWCLMDDILNTCVLNVYYLWRQVLLIGLLYACKVVMGD